MYAVIEKIITDVSQDLKSIKFFKIRSNPNPAMNRNSPTYVVHKTRSRRYTT